MIAKRGQADRKRKGPKLNKETLRDLAARNEERVKGGRRAMESSACDTTTPGTSCHACQHNETLVSDAD